jgi:hypothetical protein
MEISNEFKAASLRVAKIKAQLSSAVKGDKIYEDKPKDPRFAPQPRNA